MRDWRRKYPRIPCFIPATIYYPVVLQFLSRHRYRGGRATIHDISLGGLKIRTSTKLRESQILFISFSVSGSFLFLNTKAVVRHVSHVEGAYSCSLRFVHIADQDHLKEALEEYTGDSREVTYEQPRIQFLS